MPPKKRERETEAGQKTVKTEVSGDHEQFLHAFEKPTQIYRYLRTRSLVKPLFLYRNLSYMRHRNTRRQKPAEKSNIDSLLDKIMAKQKHVDVKNSGYLTLTYLGFYNRSNPVPREPVKLDTLLLKICHKRRKEVNCPALKVSLGTSYVAYNPSDDSPPPKVPTVSIPAETFCSGPKVKSSTILLRIVTNSEHAISANSDNDEPPAKKIKKDGDEKVTEFGTDLVIFDKQRRCHLTEGQYEFLLSEVPRGKEKTTISSTLTTWEEIGEDKEVTRRHESSFEKISNGPTLKFLLHWTKEPVTPIVDRPEPIKPTLDKNLENNVENDVKPKENLTVLYQFIYNSNSKQQTEVSSDMHCPWCWLDCKTLYSLLKHLKLCHSRFNFTYIPVQGGVRIDVSINEGHDGSYSGSLTHIPRGGTPVKRTPLTHLIVCHPKRPNVNTLSEFIDLDEKEFDNQRPYITGHNRLYHHTTTCLPIYPKEMDVDSEDESDPRWLQKKTMMMIDEFTDVNEGEKEIMKMWNLHVMKHGRFVGDCQMPLACLMFVEERGKELLRKNLYRNFVLHMASLFDFGLISPVTLFHTVKKLQDMIQSDDTIKKQLQESWQAQREHWNPISQQPENVQTLEEGRSPGIGINLTDSGQRRKPTAQDKKPLPTSLLSVNSSLSFGGGGGPIVGGAATKKANDPASQPPSNGNGSGSESTTSGDRKSRPDVRRRLSMSALASAANATAAATQSSSTSNNNNNSKPELRRKNVKDSAMSPIRRRSLNSAIDQVVGATVPCSVNLSKKVKGEQ